VKETKFFTPESLVQFARDKVVIRSILVKNHGIRDHAIILLAGCVEDTMVRATWGPYCLSEGEPALEVHVGAPLAVASGYLEDLKRHLPRRGQEHPFLKEQQAIGAVAQWGNMRTARVISHAALKFYPHYGALQVMLRSRRSSRQGQDVISRVAGRYETFLWQMMCESSSHLDSLTEG